MELFSTEDATEIAGDTDRQGEGGWLGLVGGLIRSSPSMLGDEGATLEGVLGEVEVSLMLSWWALRSGLIGGPYK